MKHYFAYHNENLIGQSVKDINLFAAYTNKQVDGTEGNIVWVISGRGTASAPKKYALSMCFIIEKANVGFSPVGLFKNSITGNTGIIFDKPIDVTLQPWLLALKKNTANFIGFKQITDMSIIPFLLAITRKSGFKPVRK